jgi:hypothetical protein
MEPRILKSSGSFNLVERHKNCFTVEFSCQGVNRILLYSTNLQQAAQFLAAAAGGEQERKMAQ